MLDAVIRFSLKYRMLVVVLSLVVLLYGGYLTTQLPIDVLPDLDRPRVVILTEAPGLAAEEVEPLVTLPIETAVLGAAGVPRGHGEVRTRTLRAAENIATAAARIRPRDSTACHQSTCSD